MTAIADPEALQRRITDELQWDLAVDSTRVQVTAAENGAVTLDGLVHTYAEKCQLEEIVKRVRGVAGVRNRIEVRLTIGDYRTDATLERVLRGVLECLARMPPERPRVSVADGWVTLDGSVPCAFQKVLAERAVRDVAGIRGITNRIAVVPRGEAARNLPAALTAALQRRAIVADAIEVTADAGRITLRGTVHSWLEHDELLELAWSATGVHAVEDHVVVGA